MDTDSALPLPAVRHELTGSLQDYLETIYEQVRDQKVARVRDIAKARHVQAGSVSPALKRLAELGLIRYTHREFIDLTPEGEEEARRIFARHQLLTRFMGEVLGMPSEAAERDACAMEHSLSDEGMDHLTRLFEFLAVCPEGRKFLASFRACPSVHGGTGVCSRHAGHTHAQVLRDGKEVPMSISELKPGERGRVTQVNGTGAIRQRLLDMGILPGTELEVERVALTGDPIWIKLQGFQLSLRRKEAGLVLLSVP